MPSERQIKTAKILNEGENSVKAAMLKAGYAESVAHNPHRLKQSPGFKEAMARFGLTEGLIAKSLVADIKKNVGDRVEELRLGAKILHMTGESEGTKIGMAVQVNISEDREKYA